MPDESTTTTTGNQFATPTTLPREKGLPVNDEYKSILSGFDEETFKKVKRAHGIYEPGDFKDWDQFYLTKRMDPYFQIGPTTEFVFFTKPDLHIFDSRQNDGTLNPELGSNSFFADCHDYRGGRVRKVLTQLQMNIGTDSCPFIRAFTNKIRSGLDLPGIEAGVQETSTNPFGTKISYRKSSISSDENVSFHTEFEDNQYLEIYTWFKAYDEYERMKFKGLVTPPNQFYRDHKILHDQIAIFKFIVTEDHFDILYWARIIGCFPKNVNRDAFSEVPADGKMKITVNWHGTFVDDMSRDIITHFNYLSSMMASGEESILDPFDSSILEITGEPMKIPRIGWRESPREGGGHIYTLQWVPFSKIENTFGNSKSSSSGIPDNAVGGVQV